MIFQMTQDSYKGFRKPPRVINFIAFLIQLPSIKNKSANTMFNIIRDNFRENNRHARPLYQNRYYPNHQNNHWNPLKTVGHVLRDNWRQNSANASPLYPQRTIDRRMRTYTRARHNTMGGLRGPYMTGALPVSGRFSSRLSRNLSNVYSSGYPSSSRYSYGSSRWTSSRATGSGSSWNSNSIRGWDTASSQLSW